MEDEHRWRLRQRQRLLFADLAGVPLSLAPDWDYPRPTAIPQDTLLKYVTSATPVGGPAGHALDKMALRLMEGDVARRALPLPPEVLYAGVHGPGPGAGSTVTGGLVAGLAFYIASKRPEVAPERVLFLKSEYEQQWLLASQEDREKASDRFVPRQLFY